MDGAGIGIPRDEQYCNGQRRQYDELGATMGNARNHDLTQLKKAVAGCQQEAAQWFPKQQHN